MSSRIQFRRGTAAQWTAANPVLGAGEPGLETDTGFEKRGDGVTAWVTLDYQPKLPPTVVTSSSPIVASRYLTPSGGDDSAAMVNALTSFAPFAYPVIVMGPGTFRWNTSIPTFARSQPVTVLGAGNGKTIIQLSSSVPRAFDFAKVADYDTFRDITIKGVSINATGVTGQHHLLLGCYQAGVMQTHLNFDNITIEDIGITGATTDPTLATHLIGICIVSQQAGSGEATQNTMTRLRVRRYKQLGGNGGVYVYQAGSVDGVNVWADDWIVDDLWHSTGITPSSYFPANNFQFGSAGSGGRFRATNLYGYGAGDTGLEVDGWDDAISEGTFENPYQAGCLNRQVGPANNALTARCVFRCTVNSSLATTRGFQAYSLNTNYPNIVRLEGCRYTNTNTTSVPSSAVGGNAIYTLQYNRFEVDDFKCSWSGWNTTASVNELVVLGQTGGAGSLSVHNMTIYNRGTLSGSITLRHILLAGTLALVTIDGLVIDSIVTNCSNSGMIGIDWGPGDSGRTLALGGGASVSGYWKMSGDPFPVGMRIGSSTNLTVTGAIRVCDSNFIGLVPSAGSPPIKFASGTDSNRTKIVWERNTIQNNAAVIFDMAAGSTLAPFAAAHRVTGTGTVSSISVSNVRQLRMLTLNFQSAGVTVSNGSAAVLNGGLDFVSAANSTLTLETDGTTWYEIARSGVGQDIVSARLSDLARNGWIRTGAIAENYKRVLVSSGTVGAPTSGTLRMIGGLVIPGGRAVSSVTLFSGTTAGANLAHSFVGIYDLTTLALLASSVDVTTAAWGAQSERTFGLATALNGPTGGGTWTPVAEQAVYIGLVVVGGGSPTYPTFSGFNTSGTPVGLAPVMSGVTADTGIVFGSLPTTAASVSGGTGVPWVYVS